MPIQDLIFNYDYSFSEDSAADELPTLDEFKLMDKKSINNFYFI